MTTNSVSELVSNFQVALEQSAKNAPWGACIMFLDSIATPEQFEQLVPTLELTKGSEHLVECYREYFGKWPNPNLSDEFRKKFPLLSAKLDNPQKIRVFFRGADSRRVQPEIMAEVLEELIHRHEVLGERKIVYKRYRGDEKCAALRFVYHTEFPCWTLERITLPGVQTSGTSTNEGLRIDWRTKAEREAAGERW